MMEIPIVVFVLVCLWLFAIGAMAGRAVELTTRTGRRDRALRNAPATWEVRIESDGPQYDYLDPGLGHSAVVLVRKVQRAKGQVRVLQRIEIGRVRASDPPEKLLDTVDRANTMIQTFALTGVA